MPDSVPFRQRRKLQYGRLIRNLLTMRTVRPPVEPARMVLTVARATTAPSPFCAMLACRHEITRYPIKFQPSADLRAAVKGEEADQKDEAAEAGQRYGVPRHLHRPAVRPEPAGPGPDDEAAHQPAGAAQQVDHARPGKV